MRPPGALRERVLGAARAEVAPTRAERRTRARAITVLAVGAPMVIWLVIGAIAPLPHAYLGSSAIGFAVALAATLALALRRGPSMLGPPTRRLALAALLVGPALIAWVVACTFACGLGTETTPWSSDLVCFSFSHVIAAAPLGALVWARRGTDPVHPRATGAVIGAAAGAAGGLLMQLHCPWGGPVHAALGHALPVVALSIVGALAFGRVLAPRRAS